MAKKKKTNVTLEVQSIKQANKPQGVGGNNG